MIYIYFFCLYLLQYYHKILVDYSTVDDHDHALSISSLSVQIYTVPTVVSDVLAVSLKHMGAPMALHNQLSHFFSDTLRA